jgi:hypothetical protein
MGATDTSASALANQPDKVNAQGKVNDMIKTALQLSKFGVPYPHSSGEVKS